MKKTAKIGTVICLTIMLFCTMISCQETPPLSNETSSEPNDTTHSSNVIRTDLIEYGPYIFVDGQYIRQYNMNTNLLAPACVDPECQGTCPLEASINEVIQVVEGKMFFYSWEAATSIVQCGYQDIFSGEIKILVTLSKLEDSYRVRFHVWDGHLYYNRKILREGGDFENPDDYIPHICRVSVDGGEEETLFASNEALVVVADNKIITRENGTMYSYDLETKNKQTLFNVEEIGYKNAVGLYQYLNGKVYFICMDDTFSISEYNKKKYLNRYLLSVDIHTGVVKRVIEEPVISYALTDDTIYYFPFEVRYLYIPEDSDPSGAVVYLASATLYACDINGENQRAVYTNENWDVADRFTVVGNKLFALIYEFDQKTHTFPDEGYWGYLDLDTKEIIPAEVEEHPGYRK